MRTLTLSLSHLFEWLTVACVLAWVVALILEHCPLGPPDRVVTRFDNGREVDVFRFSNGWFELAGHDLTRPEIRVQQLLSNWIE